VGDGAIPLASSFMASLRGIDPIFSMISLPFVAKSIDESRIMMEVAKPYFNKLLKENNQIILYTSPWPACGLWAKKPIVKSSDLKGLKIRVYDPSGTRTFNAAGASAIQLTWSDIVPQLSTGGINCILTSAEGGVFSKFWDFLDNYTELNYISPLMIIHMNADTFNDLPEDMKAAVLKAADFARDYGWTKVHARAEKNYAELRKHDVTVTKNIPQELLNHFVKSRQGAMDDWLKKMGPEGKKMLDDFYKRVNK
jgi:TRAP-type C4-dicarboxylate transport system substrate-binding protein